MVPFRAVFAPVRDGIGGVVVSVVAPRDAYLGNVQCLSLWQELLLRPPAAVVAVWFRGEEVWSAAPREHRASGAESNRT